MEFNQQIKPATGDAGLLMEDFSQSLREMRNALAVPNVPDRAAALLEELIISGRVKPGSRIIEESLARDLGISRTSLREALIYLEKAGLIAREGKAKRIIRTASRTDIIELYEMWSILESEAAAAACELAGPDVVAELERLLADMDRATDNTSYQYVNLEFHRTLALPCPNSMLRQAYIDCVKKIRWAWALTIPQHSGRADSGDDHQRIFEAYVARDSDKVRKLVRAHLLRGRARFLAGPPPRPRN